MKGRTKTKLEDELHNQLREMGCAVCRFVTKPDVDELETPAIHHIEGKTKPGSHRCVIPLCNTHHQHGTKEHPSLHSGHGKHGGKAAFEAAYRVTEYELITMCEEYLDWEYYSALESN